MMNGTALYAVALSLLACFGSTAIAGDYDSLHVVDTVALDLHAMSGISAALVSPDGTTMLHSQSEVCLLETDGESPLPSLGCADLEVRLRQPEDMLWSPDGAHLVLPTYADAFITNRDPDIQILDPATMAITNLTDDHFDGSTLNKGPGEFDIAADWIDDDTLAFIRYSFAERGMGGRTPGALMKIDIGGGAPEMIYAPLAEGHSLAYGLDVSPDGTKIAYIVDNRSEPETGGIYVFDLDGKAPPRRVVSILELGEGVPIGLGFSADNRYLVVPRPGPDIGIGLVVTVVDLESGALIPITDERTIGGVAWSPAGSALAYVTYKRDDPGGLYIVDPPGTPARQLLEGSFSAPVCCATRPFAWGSNDTMVLSDVAAASTALVVHLAR